MSNNSVEYSIKTAPNNKKYCVKSKEINTLIETLNDKKTYFCLNCKKPQLYMLDTEKITLTIEGVTFTYEALQPYCIKCGETIYVPEIHDINISRRLQAYKKYEVDKKNE